jgi:hypothetical protein
VGVIGRHTSLVLLALVASLALFPASAGAVVSRPFLGIFGPVAQPEFSDTGGAGPLAFDGKNGDLLAVDINSVNEQQQLTVEAATSLGGTYKLSFEGQSTGWKGEATLAGGQAGTGDLAVPASAASGKGKLTRLVQEYLEGPNSLVEGSTEVRNVPEPASFTLGESVYAEEGTSGKANSFIPEGATILAVNAAEHTLTLSLPATEDRRQAQLTSGSRTIKSVTTESGAFAVGQAIEGAGIAPGTTITTVNVAEHTLTLSQGITGLSAAGVALKAVNAQVTNTSGGPFTVGNAIEGAGIPSGTTIAAFNEAQHKITLSKAPTVAGTGVSLLAGSTTLTGLNTTSGAISEGEELSGSGIVAGTTIVAVDKAAGKLYLTKPPSGSGAKSGLKADLPAQASDTAIELALEKLSSIGAGNVSVSGKVTGNAVTRSISFFRGLEGYALETIACDGSGLSGTSPGCKVTETAHGHPAGVFRYHEDGTPAPFTALGENVIDGGEGHRGKPCVEEPSSCDETPQGTVDRVEDIAVDESGTATDGDIYVLTPDKVVDVFASDGHYLGQITSYKEGAVEKFFGEIHSIAVDPAGNLYVAETLGKQIHKFTPQGAAHNPLTNADSTANLADSALPNRLAAGAGPTAGYLFIQNNSEKGIVWKMDASTGALAYTISSQTGTDFQRDVAVNPADGRLFVSEGGGDKTIVNEYDASGVSGATLVSRAELLGDFLRAGLATDPASDELYVSRNPGSRVIETFGPSLRPGAQTKPVSNLTGTSATLNGAVNPKGTAIQSCSFEWGTTKAPYEHAEPCAESPVSIGEGKEPVPVHLDLSGLVPGSTYHYRLVATNAAGEDQGADEAFFTARPPVLSEEATQSVTSSEATLRAQVNPEGFSTTYEVEYGTTEAYGQSTPIRTLGLTDASPHLVSIPLEGLSPGTAYHWRLIADNTNASFPGTGSATGEDREFTTFRSFEADTECPNQSFRSGASAALPDCRAYEMVSPLDKEGGDIVNQSDGSVLSAELDQSAESGEKLAYGAYRAFGDAKAAPRTAQYVAVRHEGEGWQSHYILAPRERVNQATLTSTWNELRALSPDLCEAWVKTYAEPTLAPEAVAEQMNLYRRGDQAEGCGGEESWEALTTSVFPHSSYGTGNQFEFEGASADGSASIYAAEDNLETEGIQPPNLGGPHIGSGAEHLALYYQEEGEGKPRFVCVLPNGSPLSEGCGAGAGIQIIDTDTVSRNTWLTGAISEDGQRVFWSTIPGRKIYLRENPGMEQSASGCEAAKACTIAVSKKGEELSGTSGSLLWAAAKDGSEALYETGKDLYLFDTETAATTRIARGVFGAIGESSELSRIYFDSEEVLTSEPNSEGQVAEEGKPNIYLYEEGAGFSFVATVDPGGAVSGTLNLNLKFHTSRVTADGQHLAFMAKAPLTGYDNTDAHSGEADNEVFLYDAAANEGEGKLVCASCNPSGERPAGQQIPSGTVTTAWAAGELPFWKSNLYGGRVMSEDGTRLFFNAQDALTPRDSNGATDVYEWEAPGAGRCTESSSDYSAQDEGCLSLISSGQSPTGAELTDTSASGKDVFFTTVASLLKSDPGLVDVYDARVEGGLPEPPAPAPQCEGEACQGSPEAPNDPTPASESFQGAGNVREETPAHPASRCAKGKVRRHGKCVTRKHQAKKHKRAKRNRRAGR